jgi:hypothetical protein
MKKKMKIGFNCDFDNNNLFGRARGLPAEISETLSSFLIQPPKPAFLKFRVNLGLGF